MTDYKYIFKIILIGDSGVGKSNITSRFSHDTFDEEAIATIGVEFSSRISTINSTPIKAQLWDTAGQERYRSITTAYYRGAVGIIIVYDITNKKSFDNIGKWIEEIKQYGTDNPIILILGNKIDLGQKRIVETIKGEEFARANNCFFMETSAFNGHGITKAFDFLFHEIYKQRRISTISDDIIPLDQVEEKKTCWC